MAPITPITGTDGNDNVFRGGNDLRGTDQKDTINGLEGDDILRGLGGDDTLDGGRGADLLDGGLGNDTYIIRNDLGRGGIGNTKDAITEADNGGIDTVVSSISFVLPTNVENLKLDGPLVIDSDDVVLVDPSLLTDGTGNDLDNKITGNFRDNHLDGQARNDVLDGGGGNDTLIGGSGFDRITGGAGNDSFDGGTGLDQIIESGNVNFTLTNTSLKGNGTDTLKSIEFAELKGGSGNNTLDTTKFDLGDVALFGGAGNDTLKTGKGNDTLRGEAGDDTLQGGDGIDTYFVDSSKDKVIEASATGGKDSVFSSASFTLGANVEELTLGGGTSDINGTGNELDNTLTGDGNNNTLKGQGGKDTLTGGLGKDILVGGTGSDTLTGNGGNDRFTFDTEAAFNATTMGLDRVTDFRNIGREDDQIVLDKTTFAALKSVAGDGLSVTSDFAAVSNDALAATSGAVITYSTGTGHLFYNQNGTAAGLGSGGQFADLSGLPTVSAGDFVIQA